MCETRIHCLSVLLFCCFMQFLCAQENVEYAPMREELLQSSNLGEALSQSTITAILQDWEGFLWFGTEDGLNRYDGYTIKTYYHIPGDSGSLGASLIKYLYEDSQGRLWVGTDQGGLNLFDREKECFVRYQHQPEHPESLMDNTIVYIYEDHLKLLWLITESGLEQFDTETKVFTHYSYQDLNSEAPSRFPGRVLLEDDYGNLWVGTDYGLSLIIRNKNPDKKGHFKLYRFDTKNPKSTRGNRISCLLEDSNGNLWVGTYKGLNRFKREKGEFIRYRHQPDDPGSLSNDTITSLVEGPQGQLWIGTANGLNRTTVPEKHQDIIYFSSYYNSKHPDNYINKLMVDTHQNLWFSNYSSRNVFHFNINNNTFIDYKINNAHNLSNNTINQIYEDCGGTMWIGTTGEGKIYKYNQQRSRFPSYPSNGNIIRVRSIYEDRSGTTWLGIDKETLIQYNRSSGKTITHSLNIDHWSGGQLYAITPNKQDNGLWIGHNHGISLFDKRTHTFSHHSGRIEECVYTIKKRDSVHLWLGTSNNLYLYHVLTKQLHRFKMSLPSGETADIGKIRTLWQEAPNVLWMGTSGKGIYKLVLHKKALKENLLPLSDSDYTISHYTHETGESNSLSHNHVNCIYRDTSGILWITTYGGGLNKLHFDEQGIPHFTPYSTKNGLPNNTLYGILEDKKGFLWISSNKGISKFDPRTETFRNYDVRDGLQHNEFNNGAYFKNEKGELFFGGIHGFNTFHPKDIKDDHYQSQIAFTAFKLFDQEVQAGESPLKKSINETDTLVLSYRHAVFSLEFAALDFSLPEKNSYSYKLKGFNKDWSPRKKERKVTFTNLDPGIYTLRIRAWNSDDIRIEKERALSIVILPPWWKTSWAYALWVLLSLSILFIVFRFYIGRLRLRDQLQLEHRESKRLQEMDRIKSNFFSNITHEFRTPLTLILGPAQQLLSQLKEEALRKQAYLIERNGRKLLRLINQLLDLSKLESRNMSVSLNHGDLVWYVGEVVQAFRSLANQKQITLHFDTKIPKLNMDFDPDKLEKVLSNLLSNALKFTPEGGTVQVQMEKKDSNETGPFVTIRVKDNGMGIAAEELPRIFDRFYQVDASHTREAEGTGIGLSLCKELTELMGGSIHVDSIKELGTEFQLCLPIITGKTTQALKQERDFDVEAWLSKTPEETVKLQQTATKTPNALILLTEDNPDLRQFISQQLQNRYTVLEASNGKEALKQAREHTPDLILCDVMMPGMDGFEVSRQLKKDPKTSHIPIIFLTAKTAMESKLEGLETGADAYLTKPFHFRELKLRIQKLIEQREQLRERYQKILSLQPEAVEVDSMEARFLQELKTHIEANMQDEHFDVEALSQAMHMSRSQLGRKLKALSGHSPKELINKFRLERAYELLSQKAGAVAEIAFRVGFHEAAYFSDRFKKTFGMAPTEVLRKSAPKEHDKD